MLLEIRMIIVVLEVVEQQKLEQLQSQMVVEEVLEHQLLLIFHQQLFLEVEVVVEL